MSFKVRTIWVLKAWLLFYILGYWSNSAAQNRATVATDTTEVLGGYVAEKEVFDSLTQWIFTRKSYQYEGTLNQTEFFRFSRRVDSISPEKIVYGQYMQYRWQVFKGIEKANKKAKKRSLRLEKLEFDWRKRVVYDQNGAYTMRRVEVPFRWKKQRYLLRYEMLLWEQRWYHVGKVSFYEE